MTDPVKLFEEKFSEFLGSKHAVGVCNGTAAIHVGLLSLGVGVGDKVITTPFTFPSTVNMIIACGAEPIFVDIKKDTCCLDPDKIHSILENVSGIKGIVPAHLFGNMSDMPRIMDIAVSKGLFVLEDSSQALGAKMFDKYAGTWGDVGTFSFYPSKNFPTRGGMLVTDRDDVVDLARQVRHHGMVRGRVVRMGFNYDMPWDHAQRGEEYLQLHKPSIFAELGRYGLEDGYYPHVVYDEPYYKELCKNGKLFVHRCPVAESVAKKVREMGYG